VVVHEVTANSEMRTMSHPITSLDARRARCLHSGRHWGGATDFDY
jgi:hypothetical protein